MATTMRFKNNDSQYISTKNICGEISKAINSLDRIAEIPYNYDTSSAKRREENFKKTLVAMPGLNPHQNNMISQKSAVPHETLKSNLEDIKEQLKKLADENKQHFKKCITPVLENMNGMVGVIDKALDDSTGRKMHTANDKLVSLIYDTKEKCKNGATKYSNSHKQSKTIKLEDENTDYSLKLTLFSDLSNALNKLLPKIVTTQGMNTPPVQQININYNKNDKRAQMDSSIHKINEIYPVFLQSVKNEVNIKENFDSFRAVVESLANKNKKHFRPAVLAMLNKLSPIINNATLNTQQKLNLCNEGLDLCYKQKNKYTKKQKTIAGRSLAKINIINYFIEIFNQLIYNINGKIGNKQNVVNEYELRKKLKSTNNSEDFRSIIEEDIINPIKNKQKDNPEYKKYSNPALKKLNNLLKNLASNNADQNIYAIILKFHMQIKKYLSLDNTFNGTLYSTLYKLTDEGQLINPNKENILQETNFNLIKRVLNNINPILIEIDNIGDSLPLGNLINFLEMLHEQTNFQDMKKIQNSNKAHFKSTINNIKKSLNIAIRNLNFLLPKIEKNINKAKAIMTKLSKECNKYVKNYLKRVTNIKNYNKAERDAIKNIKMKNLKKYNKALILHSINYAVQALNKKFR